MRNYSSELTSLSCVVKPIKNPVPAREMMVPTAYKTTMAHKLDSVNNYAFAYELWRTTYSQNSIAIPRTGMKWR